MGVGEKTDSGQVSSSFPGGGWGCPPGYRTRIERGPARLTEQCLGHTTGIPGPLGTCGIWLSRPGSSSEVSEPGSRALMGWWTETRAQEALSLLGRQGDWALAESLQEFTVPPASPPSAHVGLWTQQLASKRAGHGGRSCPMGSRAVPSPGGKRKASWLGEPLSAVCSCARMGVFSDPDSSLKDRAFAFAWVPSAFHVPGSAPLGV